MKIVLVTICGESDHPLLDQFINHYSDYPTIIQMGVTNKWLSVNGDTSGSGRIFPEKMEQQNEALRQVPRDTDYIFTFDVDEFMFKDDLNDIIGILDVERPDMASFQMNQFWCRDNYVAYGGEGWGFDSWNPRVFRYELGMSFTNHRPPTPSYAVKTHLHLPHRGNHYSYAYMIQVYRKLRYYNLIYPQFDYMIWFQEVWMKWNPWTRSAIEAKWSVHPSVQGAKTRKYTGTHEIEWI